MPVLLALYASVALGFGDFFAGVGGRKNPHPGAVMSMAFVASIVGSVIAGVYVLIFPPAAFGSDDLFWCLVATGFAAFARPLLYLGMERGPIVIFAPVMGVITLIVPTIAAPLIGQSLGALEWLSLGLSLPAVVLIVSEGGGPSFSAIRANAILPLAITVGALIGGVSISLGQVDAEVGALPALITQFGSMLLIPVVTRPIRPMAPLSSGVVRFGVLVGVVDIGAVIASTIAFQRGNVAVVAAVLGFAPAVTIALASRVFGEHVRGWQWAGVGLAGFCVVLFALA